MEEIHKVIYFPPTLSSWCLYDDKDCKIISNNIYPTINNGLELVVKEEHSFNLFEVEYGGKYYFTFTDSDFGITYREVKFNESLSIGKELQQLKVGNVATIAPFARYYENGQVILESERGLPFTIDRVKRINMLSSIRSYFIKELQEWVLEEDIIECYVDGIELKQGEYPKRFNDIKFGDKVTILDDAICYEDGTVIEYGTKQQKHRIINISYIQDYSSNSNREFLLAGVQKWIKEEYIKEAWIDAKPKIKNRIETEVLTEKKIKKHHHKITGSYISDTIHEYKDLFGDRTLNNELKAINVLINDKEISGKLIDNGAEYVVHGLIGFLHKPMTLLKLTVPVGLSYRAYVKDIGYTDWVMSNTWVGNENLPIMLVEFQETQ